MHARQGGRARLSLLGASAANRALTVTVELALPDPGSPCVDETVELHVTGAGIDTTDTAVIETCGGSASAALVSVTYPPASQPRDVTLTARAVGGETVAEPVQASVRVPVDGTNDVEFDTGGGAGGQPPANGNGGGTGNGGNGGQPAPPAPGPNPMLVIGGLAVLVIAAHALL